MPFREMLKTFEGKYKLNQIISETPELKVEDQKLEDLKVAVRAATNALDRFSGFDKYDKIVCRAKLDDVVDAADRYLYFEAYKILFSREMEV